MPRLPRAILLSIFCILPLACTSTTPPPASQPVPPSPASVAYENPTTGIAFSLPPGWKQAPPKDMQVRFDSPAPAKISLTLDVPKLPWHPYGLIPIGSVRDGYVDDQKKKVPDAKSTDLPNPTVADANQRRVKTTGHLNGASVVDDAAMLVHADHVYILSLDCDEATYPAAKAALDTALQTLHWVQKK